MGHVNGMKLLIAEPSHKKVKGVSRQSGFSSRSQEDTVRPSGESLTPLNLHSSMCRAAIFLLSKSKDKNEASEKLIIILRHKVSDSSEKRKMQCEERATSSI